MRSSYKKLGSYIREVSVKNKDLEIEKLLGVSITKAFIPSIANTVGTDMSKYKIVRTNQFAYGPVTSRNGEKISVALLQEDDCIISTSYTVFEIIDHEELDPEYLMMWFRRPEFDRYARYKSHGSVREIFGWDEMCDVELPIPSIEKQQEIVAEYNTIVNRIQLNEQMNQKLEETAQTIYKHWFVDFEFPISAEYAASIGKPELEGKPYKSSGGEMAFCAELDGEAPVVFKAAHLKDIATYSKNRILLSELTLENYISTENMFPERGGVTSAATLPSAKSVSKFNIGDILISNIRPYFKKIWKAEFSGGCSNDVLCISSKTPDFNSFLYQTLEPDSFFEYVMNGSKGTKMPRGDKKWIMNYPVIIPDENTLRKYNQIYTGSYIAKIEKKTENILLSNFSGVFLSQMSLRGKAA